MTTPSIRSSVHRSRRQRRSWLAGCCLLLLIVAATGFVERAVAQNAGAPIVTASQQAQQSRQQAKRREEIRQRKIDNPEAEEGANVYRHSATVHGIARSLGLSVEATSRMFESINFILLLVAIVWVVRRTLPRALRNRTERIRTEIEQARIATEEASRRLARVEERLERLDSEIEAIRRKANQETTLEEERLREAMEQEKRIILESAAQDIDAASKNAQSQLKRMAAELAIENARRRIASSGENDHTLVEGFLTDLNRKHPGRGVN